MSYGACPSLSLPLSHLLLVWGQGVVSIAVVLVEEIGEESVAMGTQLNTAAKTGAESAGVRTAGGSGGV